MPKAELLRVELASDKRCRNLYDEFIAAGRGNQRSSEIEAFALAGYDSAASIHVEIEKEARAIRDEKQRRLAYHDSLHRTETEEAGWR